MALVFVTIILGLNVSMLVYLFMNNQEANKEVKDLEKRLKEIETELEKY